jgi:hypothetical protein
VNLNLTLSDPEVLLKLGGVCVFVRISACNGVHSGRRGGILLIWRVNPACKYWARRKGSLKVERGRETGAGSSRQVEHESAHLWFLRQLL